MQDREKDNGGPARRCGRCFPGWCGGLGRGRRRGNGFRPVTCVHAGRVAVARASDSARACVGLPRPPLWSVFPRVVRRPWSRAAAGQRLPAGHVRTRREGSRGPCVGLGEGLCGVALPVVVVGVSPGGAEALVAGGGGPRHGRPRADTAGASRGNRERPSLPRQPVARSPRRPGPARSPRSSLRGPSASTSRADHPGREPAAAGSGRALPGVGEPMGVRADGPPPAQPRSTSAWPATTSSTCSHSAANAAFTRPSSSR